MPKKSILLAVLLLLLTLALIRLNAPAAHPPAVAGLLDLSQWDFERDGPVHLGGEWEFVWGELLEPGDFPRPAEAGVDFLAVPGA